jgi:hypothetical protein
VGETGTTAADALANLSRYPSRLEAAFGDGLLPWLVFRFVLWDRKPFQGFMIGAHLGGGKAWSAPYPFGKLPPATGPGKTTLEEAVAMAVAQILGLVGLGLVAGISIGTLAAQEYYKAGKVNVIAGLLIAVGFAVGGFFGGKWALGIDIVLMRKVFSVILVVLAVRGFPSLWATRPGGAVGLAGPSRLSRFHEQRSDPYEARETSGAGRSSTGFSHRVASCGSERGARVLFKNSQR